MATRFIISGCFLYFPHPFPFFLKTIRLFAKKRSMTDFYFILFKGRRGKVCFCVYYNSSNAAHSEKSRSALWMAAAPETMRSSHWPLDAGRWAGPGRADTLRPPKDSRLRSDELGLPRRRRHLPVGSSLAPDRQKRKPEERLRGEGNSA